jgi:hypothetical protein
MPPEQAAILDGGSGGGGGNGGAGGDPAAAAAAAAASQNNGGGAGGSQPAAPWYAGAGYTDEDRTYLQGKGWHEGPEIPRKVFDSYRHLEKLMGGKANAVVIPKPDDAAAMDEFYGKLGRPEKPDAYTLPSTIPEETAKAFAPETLKAYQEIAHKARLTNDQFGAAMEMLTTADKAANEAADVRYNTEVAQTKEKLNVEFGAKFGEEVARGNLAMRTLGISTDDRDAMSEAMGVEKATRMLMKIGGMLAQHKAVGLDNGGKPAEGFVTDKAKAQQRISEIKMLAKDATGPNADFRRALMEPGHPEHKNVQAQWREWQRVANSG